MHFNSTNHIFRITPACAGNRQSARWCTLRRKDHPRLRGEQRSLSISELSILGSPPLARGTVTNVIAVLALIRITPACAGNSRAAHQSRGHGGDHPRLRGEQYAPLYGHSPSVGSPPLARGTARHLPDAVFFAGITPACAGNRSAAVYRCRSSGDHPRLRGEQVLIVQPRI